MELHAQNIDGASQAEPLMKTFMAKKEEVQRSWYVVDAADHVLGRLATRIAMVLMGKNKPTYTPHVDTGDFVIVTNASRIRVTGRKLEQKEYQRYSGYPGGQKRTSLGQLLQKSPDTVIRLAVRRMLPKNRLAAGMLKKLKVYRGQDHPHQAQQPTPLEVNA